MKNFMAYQVDDEDRAEKKRIFDDNGLRSPVNQEQFYTKSVTYVVSRVFIVTVACVCQLP